MANVGTFTESSRALLVAGIAGTGDNAVVMEVTDAERFVDFTIMSTAGAMDVLISLDGTNFSTAPLSLADLGAASTAPVLVTAANQVYRFRGPFKAVRVQQNGGTAVANPAMSCSKP